MATRNFWRGKTVLVTGHTGFKGAWLSLWLASLGARVVGYALRPTGESNLFEIARVPEFVTDIDGDVRDLAALRRAVDRHAPEIVVHMAAQALVRESYRTPVDTFATNVMGTVNVLEAARQGARAILIVTSDKCYEPRADESAPHVESDAMGGHDPYSSSKGCAELVTAAYRRSFFADGKAAVASARAGNIIGGGDFSVARLIPDLVSAALKARRAVIRNPNAVRPWQFVIEPLAGYMALVERLWQNPDRFAAGWNFGPRDAAVMTVGEICERFARLWGGGFGWDVVPDGAMPERGILQLDAGKAALEIPFMPKLSTVQGLEATVEWYRAWQSGQDMQHFTLGQIEQLGAAHIAAPG